MLSGKRITGFTDTEEDAAGFAEVTPLLGQGMLGQEMLVQEILV